VLVKPAGPDCNLACTYCFYRPKAALYPDTPRHRMTDETLREFVRQYMAMSGPQVSFGWQGGEPTLMGVDFYRKAVEYQQRFGRSGQVVSNGLQTNGVLLDEQWCRFLARYRFLVGLSIDGPAEVHDHYRVYGSGRPSHADVLASLNRLREAGVEYNAMVMVTPASVGRAREVWEYLTGELDFQYLQFIPLIEKDPETGKPAPFTVDPRAYGDFLCEVFDLWAARDEMDIHVRTFDDLLFVYAGMESPSCTSRARCGTYVVVEHNGDIYCCDFFVDRDYLLGNLMETPLTELVASERFERFAERKSDLDATCRECQWLRMCHGDCPKYRLAWSESHRVASYFCPSYKRFFAHSQETLERKVREIMELRREQERQAASQLYTVGRNEPCPCGSGRKYKQCCMR
jgi:uncharacterized protein